MPLPQQPGPHELKYLAQELSQAVRALIERHDLLREQLFMAAKQAKQQTKAKRATPKCGAKKASGGRCATRLQPGQFRCDLHASQMRQRRDANPNQAGKKRAHRDAPGEVPSVADRVAGASDQLGALTTTPTLPLTSDDGAALSPETGDSACARE